MWSMLIVNIDGLLSCFYGMFCRVKNHVKIKFVFQNSIYSFGQSVLVAVPFLRHANSDIVAFEDVRVLS